MGAKEGNWLLFIGVGFSLGLPLSIYSPGAPSLMGFGDPNGLALGWPPNGLLH